jgi:hypothetical protein
MSSLSNNHLHGAPSQRVSIEGIAYAVLGRARGFIFALLLLAIATSAYADANAGTLNKPMQDACRTDFSRVSRATPKDFAAAFGACVHAGGLQTALSRHGEASAWIATSRWGAIRAQGAAVEVPHPKLQWLPEALHHEKDADTFIATGTWQRDGVEAIRGRYAFVWSLDRSKKWRIRFGLMTEENTRDLAFPSEIASSVQTQSSAGRTGDLLTLAEVQFGGICGSNGMAAAFDLLADDGIRVLRNDGVYVGKTRIANDPRTRAERWSYIPQGQGIDSALRHAYVFGRYNLRRDDGSTERGYYVRIWRAENASRDARADFSNWRVIVDAATPTARSW